ncbi:enoyl-CoA hydratase-related protein [Mycolicibacterium fortuitum]|uniref:enoyl-CoA hydratase-related protein n=1 Tax=Mycolicibacterium fortuitum TaxID=1766 RepID=UPI00148FEAF8|nr:enoyl-CoA hydratase/isomerase family protein [Mycolicibacterium fortuitum]
MTNIPAVSGSGATDSAPVELTRPHPSVVLITLRRTDKLNAIDLDMTDAIEATCESLADEHEVSVVILTGAGRGFSSGADLSSLAAHAAAGARAMMRTAGRSVRALARLPQLTICAVNGPAVGAGFGLVLACDLRIASPTARFGATFANMGLGPDFGLSRTLPGTVGRHRALELLLSTRLIDATEALRLGLVNEIADDAVERSRELAEQFVRVPLRTIRSIKATLAAAENADFDRVVDQIEAEAQTRLLEHPDFLSDASAWIAPHM